jgi:hypothetical protein
MWLVSVLSLLWLTQVFASISTLITLLTVPDSGGGGINSNRTNSFVFLSLYLIIYFLYSFVFLSLYLIIYFLYSFVYETPKCNSGLIYLTKRRNAIRGLSI